MRRPRAYIPYPERLAAAYACLLPQDVRDDLRARHVPAEVVERMFTDDHIDLHALGGSDKWWNLDPKLRPEHKEKSRRDTSIVAKSRRLTREQEEFRRKVLDRPCGAKRERSGNFPRGRKIRGRGFEKRRAVNRTNGESQ